MLHVGRTRRLVLGAFEQDFFVYVSKSCYLCDMFIYLLHNVSALSAGVIEYKDCITTER